MITQRKVLQAVTLTGFIFGAAGWVYIALVALVHPETLPIQLTHLTPWIREDTFGIISFIVSAICFFAWNLVRK